jgi:hypothetical protein
LPLGTKIKFKNKNKSSVKLGFLMKKKSVKVARFGGIFLGCQNNIAAGFLKKFFFPLGC